jgi:hypothetical protein
VFFLCMCICVGGYAEEKELSFFKRNKRERKEK